MNTKLNAINTTDIRDAIALGCQTMANVFNADDPLGAPYFGSRARPDAHLSFPKTYSDAHTPGRHLNALLNAQNCGIEVSQAAIYQHARVALASYDGVLPLPLGRKQIEGAHENFRSHNLREGLHALYALAAFRQDERALEIAEESIASIRELWHPERVSVAGYTWRSRGLLRRLRRR